MAEERKEYLRQVEHFCTQAGNDWYQVYLVRKLTSLLGMESVQSLSQPGHPAQWVFPKDVIAQQVRARPGSPGRCLCSGSQVPPSLASPCLLRGRPAAALGPCPWAPVILRSWWHPWTAAIGRRYGCARSLHSVPSQRSFGDVIPDGLGQGQSNDPGALLSAP